MTLSSCVSKAFVAPQRGLIFDLDCEPNPARVRCAVAVESSVAPVS